jgi:endonuclease/exonuclease/phosphatase family metal-dependent hydrolase
MTSFVLKTWNCFGAAQDARSFLRWRGIPDAHRLRHPEVTSVLCAADVLCIQEVFLSEAESLFDTLEHAHKTRDLNGNTYWPPAFAGSGLGLASRFRMTARSIRPFRGPTLGAERFARKGMLHARLRLVDDSDMEVDVLTTHLQSGYGPRARFIRAQQLAQLRSLVDEVGSRERAFLVCGDLNIDGLAHVRGGEYAALRATLPDFADLGADQDHITFHPDQAVNTLAHRFEQNSPPQRIDYVLFRPAHRGGIEPERCDLVLRDPLPIDGGVTFASDHFGLRVSFRALRGGG